METEQPMRIFCKANTSLNVAVLGEELHLVPADSSDKSQHWIQDYSSAGKVADFEGRRAFALVNRTTGQAMVNLGDKGTVHVLDIYGRGQLTLAPYSGHVAVELSKLWSLGERHQDGFSTVRVLHDIKYNLNALGAVRHGTVVGLFPAQKDGTNSLWKIVDINQE